LSSESDVVDQPRAAAEASGESTGESCPGSPTTSTLNRNELQLAQLELSTKANKAGLRVGMVGAAGLLAL
jgi:hypothetical protein